MSEHLGKVFDGRWKYVGNYTFENVFNGNKFVTTAQNASHIFVGRTTITKLIAFECRGKRHSERTIRQRAFAIKQKRRIA